MTNMPIIAVLPVNVFINYNRTNKVFIAKVTVKHLLSTTVDLHVTGGHGQIWGSWC